MSSHVLQTDKSVFTTSIALVSALTLLATVLFLVAALIGVISRVPPDDGSRKGVAVIERIKPVAQVAIAVPKPAGAEIKLTGQEVYNKVCINCHAAGVLGAPKVGVKELWEPRFAQGLNTLVNNALSGIRAMPAKGGDPSLTEANIHDAIVYMLGETGIKTDEAAK
ncbi:MAG: cytochrome c5 family protein [Candidatus Contendobacter sp.]|nr:cytochrome c5 family protein [Candidatus Contendobacter sp.]MCC8998801.1 c-type cytochrome [Candidatus Contendobacter sp.]